MNIEVLGFTIETIGKIMIAFTVIKIYHRFFKEYRIAQKVFKEMKNSTINRYFRNTIFDRWLFLQLPSKLN